MKHESENDGAMRQPSDYLADYLAAHFGADEDAELEDPQTDPERQAARERADWIAGVLEEAAQDESFELQLPVQSLRRLERVPLRRLGLAASVLLMASVTIPAVLGGAAAWSGQLRANQALRLVVTGPLAAPVGAPVRIAVETWDDAGSPLASEISWELVALEGPADSSDSGAPLVAGRLSSDGEARIVVPAGARTGRARLNITAQTGGRRQSASFEVHAGGAAPFVHLSSDKPVYRPGETVYLRASFLDRRSLEPRVGSYNVALIDGGENEIATRRLGVSASDQGVASVVFEIPDDAPGGRWSFVVKDGANEFEVEQLPLLVRAYEPPRLAKSVLLGKRSYAPGERGAAELLVRRTAGGVPAGAAVAAWLVVDGREVWRTSDALDDEGRLVMRFDVPADPSEIERGEARLFARITDGGIVETAIEPFTIPVAGLDVAFYPEGGQLVAGVENRVYATVHDAQGRAAGVTGALLDERGRELTTFRTEHEGRARFAFTPELGRSYRLRLDGESRDRERTHALPPAVQDAVLLSALRRVTSSGQPLELRVHTPDAGPWLVGAFLNGELVAQDAVEGAGAHDLALAIPEDVGGVLRVTVFGRDMRPRAERLVQVEGQQGIEVALEPVQATLAPGGAQRVRVTTRDEAGRPVAATVGLAVSDAALRELAGEPRLGILDSVALAAELGQGELSLQTQDLGSFFSADFDARRNVDLLLGTQGWRRYLWMAERDVELADRAAELGDRARRVELFEGANSAPAVVDTWRETGPELSRERRRVRDILRSVIAISVLIAGCAGLSGLVLLTLRRFQVRWANRYAWPLGTLLSVLGVLSVLMLWQRSEPAVGFAAAEPVGRAFLDGSPRERSLVAGIESRPDLDVLRELGYVSEEEDGVWGFDGADDIPVEIAQGASMAPTVTEQALDALAGLGYIGLSDQDADDDAGDDGQFRWLVVEYAHDHGRSRDLARLAGIEGRSDFAETLYWNPRVTTDAHGTAEIAFDTSERITTWDVVADAHGAGRVGQGAATFATFQPLFLDAVLPAELSVGDELLFPVAITALDDRDGSALDVEISSSLGDGAFTEPLVVRLEREPVAAPAQAPGGARREDGYQADASERQEARGARGARGRAYVAFAPERSFADLDLTLRGEQRGTGERDALRRGLSVVPRGFPVRVERVGTLRDSVRFEVAIPEEVAYDSVRARVVLQPSRLSGVLDGLEGMLREPHGCFEQTSSVNYPNVLALALLRATGTADPALERRARGLLDAGRDRLAGFWCRRGGFDWFGSDPGHLGLTAYGLLQFTDMQRVHAVDAELVTKTRAWLLEQRDGAGGFESSAGHPKFGGRAPEEIVDAYVLWALADAGVEPAELATELDAAQRAAAASDDPYQLALEALALEAGGRGSAAASARRRLGELQDADGHLDGRTTSITNSRGNSLAVETTALAVLAWLAGAAPGPDDVPGPDVMGAAYDPGDPGDAGNSGKTTESRDGAADQRALELERADRALRWLATQRNSSGTYGATQATVLVLRAIVARVELDPSQATPIEGEFTIEVASSENGSESALGDERRGAGRPIPVRPIPVRRGQVTPLAIDGLEVELRPGTNQVTLAFMPGATPDGSDPASSGRELPYAFALDYYAAEPADDPEGQIEVETQLAAGFTGESGEAGEPGQPGESGRVREGANVSLNVRVTHAGDEPLGMVLARVGVPAGLEVPTESLDALRQSGDVDFWELDGREVILYWRGFGARQVRELSIDTLARIPGTTTGPASRAYPYYDPNRVRWASPLTVIVEP